MRYRTTIPTIFNPTREMKHTKDRKATVKATGETLNVYPLQNGNFYDADATGANELPTATKSGKKEFTKDELTFY